MKVLIIGARGQLGWELQRTVPDGIPAPICMDVADEGETRLDITDAAAVEERIGTIAPDVIINSAAYTAVDAAEDNEALAFAINEAGAANLARAAKRSGCRIIHTSTDFVFDGQQTTPYAPDDAPNPLGVYGHSKLAGESAVLESGANAAIIRTAWLYSAHGGNFVKTMLRLMREKDELGVVGDQRGSPTWARSLATAIWRLVERPQLQGIYHWCDAGVISWYDFAAGIQEEAVGLGMLDRAIPINAITTADYPTPAARPAYSALETTGTAAALDLKQTPWREALREMLVELRKESREE